MCYLFEEISRDAGTKKSEIQHGEKQAPREKKEMYNKVI